MNAEPGQHALAEVIVDLDAIAHNVRTFVRAASSVQVMVVVKADAYNHGVEQVARTALEAGASQLGTATFREALHLRVLGFTCPVTAWMWYPGQDLTEVLAQKIVVGIPSLAHARDLVRQAQNAKNSATPQAVLMFDSGLSRSGVGPREWQDTVETVAEAEQAGTIKVTGLMTHLSSADTPGDTLTTDLQAKRFKEAIAYCRARGIEAPVNHMANTPATLTRPDTHLQMVRPGVGVFGVDPVDPPVDAGLRPAMTLRARVTTTRIVPAGEGVSYGLTWRAEADTRTAVVAMGYADGLPRSLSGNFEVSINGVRYPQIGRVCMDQVVINLGSAESETPVQPGDWAVIFGNGGPSVEEVAQRAGTIPYEILTMPRGRVSRRFLPVKGQPINPLDALDFSQPATVSAPTPEDMREIGIQLGQQLRAGTVVVLTGPLGAGKTTLTQGIAQGLGVRGRVQSPTFTIVRTHKAGNPDAPGLLHMDAYRLLGAEVADGIEPGKQADPNLVLDALESLDLDADLDNSVVVAEWGRGVVEQLSENVLDVELVRAVAETSLADSADSADSTDPANTEEGAELDELRTVTWNWVKRS